MKTIIRFLETLIVFIFLFHASISLAEMTSVVAKIGESFTLQAGQSAKIQGTHDEIVFKIKGFSYFNNGSVVKGDIHATLIINGEIMEDPGKYRYDVEMIDSDFKTFATHIVWRSETHCQNTPEVSKLFGRAFNERNSCWSKLAKRFSDKTICSNISNAMENTLCIESVLEKLQQPMSCHEVSSPRAYCRFIEATTTLNPQLCIGIISTDYYEKCFKEISSRTNQGDKICEGLSNGKRNYEEECKDIVNNTIKPIRFNRFN